MCMFQSNDAKEFFITGLLLGTALGIFLTLLIV